MKFIRQKIFFFKVIYVDTGRVLTLEEEKSLYKNIELAKRLGMEVNFIFDSDIVNGILKIADREKLDEIILGKSLNKNFGKRISLNISKKLLKNREDLKIYIISPNGFDRFFLLKLKILTFFKSVLEEKKFFMYSFFALFFITFINLFLAYKIGYWSVGLIFLATIGIIGSYTSKKVVVLNAVLTSLIWNFFFIPPIFTFRFAKLEDFIMDLIFLVVAVIIGNFNSKLRKNEQLLKKKEKKLQILYGVAKIINEGKNADTFFTKIISYLEESFQGDFDIIIFGNKKKFKNDDLIMSCQDYKKKISSYKNLVLNDENHCIPMVYKNKIKGIIKVKFTDKKFITLDILETLENIANQIATDLENRDFLKIQKEMEIAKESEKIYKVILDSISHELRTPITAITTATSGLCDENIMKNLNSKIILINDIVEATDRLNRIIGNLLDTIKVESGRLKINLDWNYVSELVGSVALKFNKICKNHEFLLEVEKNIPILKFDFVLIEQVIFNLLYNAYLYTPEGSKIILKVFKKDNIIKIIVEDNGFGIAEHDIKKIFNKFYRGKGISVGGTGLGLSICKSIVELHKGKIYCKNLLEGGLRFTIELDI